MIDPLFWLGLSILLVAVSLTAVLVVALPALQELARAARSAEKLFDTLSRELPPTLEAIRLTGLEISDLTDDVSEGVQQAGSAIKQVDQSVTSAKRQAREAGLATRSFASGVKAAWKNLTGSSPRTRKQAATRRSQQQADRLPAADPIDLSRSRRDGEVARYQQLAQELDVVPPADPDTRPLQNLPTPKERLAEQPPQNFDQGL